MASKKGVGSSKNGRESESKRLGLKLFGGQIAKAGNITVMMPEVQGDSFLGEGGAGRKDKHDGQDRGEELCAFTHGFFLLVS